MVSIAGSKGGICEEIEGIDRETCEESINSGD